MAGTSCEVRVTPCLMRHVASFANDVPKFVKRLSNDSFVMLMMCAA